MSLRTHALAHALLVAAFGTTALLGSSRPASAADGLGPTPDAVPRPYESPATEQEARQEEPSKPPIWDIPGRVGYAINEWFRQLVISALSPVLDALGKTIFSTPHLEQNERIRELWRFSVGLADAALVLFVMAGSGIVMSGGGLSAQLSAKDLLPRLIVAVAAVNLSLLFVGQFISVSNALSRALLGSAVNPSDLTTAFSERIFSGTSNIFLLLLVLLIVVLAVLVLVSYVIRVAALVILIAGAPLLLLNHALPQSDGLARAWWRAVVALLAAPVAQALLVAAALRVFLTGDALGLPAGGGLIDLLVIGCLFYLLYKIPFWTLNAALAGAGSRAWSSVKQRAMTAAKAAMA